MIEGDEDPDTNNDTSSENQNDNGAKISHGCSSVKTESMVDRKFQLQSKRFLTLVAQTLFRLICIKG